MAVVVSKKLAALSDLAADIEGDGVLGEDSSCLMEHMTGSADFIATADEPFGEVAASLVTFGNAHKDVVLIVDNELFWGYIGDEATVYNGINRTVMKMLSSDENRQKYEKLLSGANLTVLAETK